MGALARTGKSFAGLISGCLAMGLISSAPAAAQHVVEVPLVLQDFSDCTNTNVADPNGMVTRGTAWLTRNSDGTTSVKVGITVKPNTTYHFFLKCARQLGDITTGEEGAGEAEFSFPTNSVGSVFAFDIYPEGAPAGNKLQSVTVNMQ